MNLYIYKAIEIHVTIERKKGERQRVYFTLKEDNLLLYIFNLSKKWVSSYYDENKMKAAQ